MNSKKILILPAVAIAISTFGMTSSAFAASPTVEVDVMTHLCDPSIKNANDFQALTNGKSTLAGFANQVLHCPTTVLPGNAPVAGSVASPQTPFNYTIKGEHFSPLSLQGSMYHPEALCESDLNVDVNGDGVVSSTTCLDSSEYHLNEVNADNGRVVVQETTPPQGYHFGALLFTPEQVDGNNDAHSLLYTDPVQGTISLDTTNDADKVITLHVYDFANSDNPQGLVNGRPASVGPTGSTTASSSMMMGSTSMSISTSSLIAQILTLQQQIHELESQIVALLARLVK